MRRDGRGAGFLAAALAIAAATAGAVRADDALHRVAGEVATRVDALGRVVLVVDVFGPDGVPDGVVDEAYLLAPSAGEVIDLPRGPLTGEVTWSRADGFVAVVDRGGVERLALATRAGYGGARAIRGVELVRVAGGLEDAPEDFDTTAIPSMLWGGRGEPGAPHAFPDACQSGGPGAMSCGRRCTTLGAIAGGTSCAVSCGAGYYACCRCDGGIVARCYCRLAPRLPVEPGPGPGDDLAPCYPECSR